MSLLETHIPEKYLPFLDPFLKTALAEDHGPGDYSSASVVSPGHQGQAELKIKEPAVLAGLDLVAYLVDRYDPELTFKRMAQDGERVAAGTMGLRLEGSLRSILGIERLLLNCVQHMSGIATQTRRFVDHLQNYSVKLLDTRKTTPTLRFMDKWAVEIGGGVNHRFGLYDMIMLKDNHVDAAGGINQALERAHSYRLKHHMQIPIEIETRSLKEVEEVLHGPLPDIIMFDNYTPSELQKGVELVQGRCETEASGGITMDNIIQYAQTGVDGISTSALTRPASVPDLSLKVLS